MPPPPPPPPEDERRVWADRVRHELHKEVTPLRDALHHLTTSFYKLSHEVSELVGRGETYVKTWPLVLLFLTFGAGVVGVTSWATSLIANSKLETMRTELSAAKSDFATKAIALEAKCVKHDNELLKLQYMPKPPERRR